MQIGEQKARVINNIENNFADERLHGALQELLAVVGTAVAEGALDERRAMALESAAGEVGRAVAEEGKGSSRLRRAIENLRLLSSGMTASAEIAGAVETIVHTAGSA